MKKHKTHLKNEKNQLGSQLDDLFLIYMIIEADTVKIKFFVGLTNSYDKRRRQKNRTHTKKSFLYGHSLDT